MISNDILYWHKAWVVLGEGRDGSDGVKRCPCYKQIRESCHLNCSEHSPWIILLVCKPLFCCCDYSTNTMLEWHAWGDKRAPSLAAYNHLIPTSENEDIVLLNTSQALLKLNGTLISIWRPLFALWLTKNRSETIRPFVLLKNPLTSVMFVARKKKQSWQSNVQQTRGVSQKLLRSVTGGIAVDQACVTFAIFW